MSITRRQFFNSTAVIVGGTMAAGKVWGANDKIGVGCIGLHGRGGSHMGAFSSKESDSEVVALCDVDKDVLSGAATGIEKATGKKPKTYRDMRDMFADEKVDAVTIATPNHWHSLATIWACQAGKDVYVEKPLSHNVWEGRQVVEAAKKYNRIVQHGTQRRSETEWMSVMDSLHSGAIGEVFMARALCYKTRNSIDTHPDEEPPKNLDWNLWQGPIQERAYSKRFVHYNWHWFWDYGNGDIGNQGVHQMDVAVWGMNRGLPVKVQSMGGRYGYKDDGQTPNTQTASFTYADGSMLVFEVRGRSTNDEAGTRIGNLFYGSNGYFVEADDDDSKDTQKLSFYDPSNKRMDVKGKEFLSKGNYNNFLTAVRSRNEADIRGTALEGHISSVHCHLANIAYRLGRTLTFNPDTEQFVGDEEANALLTITYRKEFEVPKIV